MTLNIPFKIFANCIPVNGHSRSLIVDIQREKYYFIPNSLYSILKTYNGQSINNILQKFDQKDHEVLIDYFKFLDKNELIFYTSDPSLFPDLDFTKWKCPSLIYQAILDIDSSTNYLTSELFVSLDKLNCKYIDIRVFGSIDPDYILQFLKHAENSSIIGIDLYLEFTSIAQMDKIRHMLSTIFRINTIYFYNADKNKFIKPDNKEYFQNAVMIKDKICVSSCGVVSKNYFTANISSVTKAINQNSCLSGKISINTKGDIMNCPSFKKNYGNLATVKLEDAIKLKEFRRLWSITKDKVNICKDCEFRYICIDCRAYIENPKDKYSKPLKCGYDPYTNKWEDWSSNLLKQKIMNHYEEI